MKKIGLAFAVVFAFAACNKVDNEDMAKKIKEQLTTNGVTVKDVSCPSGQSIKEGTKFDCTVKVDDSMTVPIHIEIMKDKMFTANFDEDAQMKIIEKMALQPAYARSPLSRPWMYNC